MEGYCTKNKIVSIFRNMLAWQMKKGDVNYTCKLEKYLKKFFGKPLNECFDEMVVVPFGLYDICFLLKDRQRAVNANDKEEQRQRL